MGRDNPAELKAQKLARSFTRGVVDRSLRPDTEDKRRIQETLRLAPNRWGPSHGLVCSPVCPASGLAMLAAGVACVPGLMQQPGMPHGGVALHAM